MAHILVVEDNPQNLKLTTIILESDGHTVVSAVDSAEANRALAQRIPDLILMDMALPGTDGYTLSRELRSRSETCLLPILGLSAFAMPGDAEKALAAGCSDYLTKPIRRVVLLERVAALLGSSVGGPASAALAPVNDGKPTSEVDGP
ncbi:MAG: response regulator [Thermoplasmata archaeon]